MDYWCCAIFYSCFLPAVLVKCYLSYSCFWNVIMTNSPYSFITMYLLNCVIYAGHPVQWSCVHVQGWKLDHSCRKGDTKVFRKSQPVRPEDFLSMEVVGCHLELPVLFGRHVTDQWEDSLVDSANHNTGKVSSIYHSSKMKSFQQLFFVWIIYKNKRPWKTSSFLMINKVC